MRKSLGILNLPKDAVYDEMNSPVGNLTIITSSEGLHAIIWDQDRQNPFYAAIINNLKKSQTDQMITQTKQQLNEYFAGKRTTFDLPIVLNGTSFQIQVWQQLLKIPYGSTISYGTQAERIGDKKKARAVGIANGLNPISIVVPCHRVIGNNGKLTGFAGGIDKKDYLLKLEKKLLG